MQAPAMEVREGKAQDEDAWLISIKALELKENVYAHFGIAKACLPVSCI